MAGRRINSIDIVVGKRLRMQRLAKGLSQLELASRMENITFQQIQKYENGQNRISSGRLYELSEILGVQVEFFFQDVAGHLGGVKKKRADAQAQRLQELANSAEGTGVLAVYFAIPDRASRIHILEIMKSLVATTRKRGGRRRP